VREAEAPLLAQSLGVTHAVLGQVGGRRGRLELTLKVVQVPAGAAVGEPITLDGSEEDVRAGLPGAAREIASRLGVTAPRKPDGPVDSAADLRRIGRLPWYPGEMLPQDQLQALEQMSRRSALAALMWVVNRGVVQDPMLEFAGRAALARAPGHPLMLAQVARSCNFVSAYGAVGEGAGAIEKGVEAYPRNHLYRVAQTYLLRSRGEFNGARQAAEAAVATSFRNPSAWLLLDATYTAWSESIRHGKTVDALSAEQLEACRKLYELGLVAAQRATELDPRHLDGWIMLSSTAAFAGDAELADAAFWKAAAAYPEEPAVYRWGLQLYHPKWYEDPAKAARVARRAAEAAAAGGRSWSPAERIEVAAYAYLVGFPEVAEGIVRTADERRTLKEWVEANADQVVPAAQ
jgi:tetratricopeptide (TPR) repeat protein